MKRSSKLSIGIFLFLVFCAGISADTGAKTAVAVIDFQNREGVSPELASTISDYFRTKLFNSNKYILVTRENMDSILSEQNFQLSGCTSQECAIQMGKILGVSKIFTGTIGMVGSIYLVNINMLNIETGEIEKAESEEVHGGKENLLLAISNIADRVSGKITAPRVQAPPAVAEKKPSEYIGYTFTTFSFGMGPGFIKSLKFTSEIGVNYADLGITGTLPGPFDSLEFKDLEISQGGQFGFQMAMMGHSKDKKVTGSNFFAAFHLSFTWFKMKAQTGTYVANETWEGTYNFTMDDYFSSFILDDTLRIGLAGNFTKKFFPYLGIGVGITMALYSLPYCKGFTEDYVNFIIPSNGFAIGFFYQPFVGVQFNAGNIPIQIELCATSDKYFMKRNIEEESDSAVINRFIFTIGTGFTKINK